jgi:GntR family transcriptional repressor for pyruvate dehydrogenase complex
VRSIFEPAVASRAAIRAQAGDIAALDQIVQEQHGFLGWEVPNNAWLESDRAFHVAVARASRNEVSIRVIRLINELLHEGRRHFATQSDRREHAYIWHRDIFEHIRAAEPQQARDAMMRHLREVEEFIVGEVIAPADGNAAGPEEPAAVVDGTAADTA